MPERTAVIESSALRKSLDLLGRHVLELDVATVVGTVGEGETDGDEDEDEAARSEPEAGAGCVD
jgi:hypothetical protein